MNTKHHIHVLLTLVALAVTALVGCSNEESSAPPKTVTQVVEPRDALSEELMVLLGQAKNFHSKADVYESDGKFEVAIGELQKIVELPFGEDYPEGEDVLIDTYARLAGLHIRLHQWDEAMSYVDKGMDMQSRESFFLANLYTVKGQILQGRAAGLEDEAQATELKRQAIQAFDTSIQINQRILEALETRDESQGGAP